MGRLLSSPIVTPPLLGVCGDCGVVRLSGGVGEGDGLRLRLTVAFCSCEDSTDWREGERDLVRDRHLPTRDELLQSRSGE